MVIGKGGEIMILGDKTYLRNFEVGVQNDVVNQIRVDTQNENNKKIKRKKGKNPDNNIYRDLKSKVNIANKSHQDIKAKLKLATDQEEKVNQMESTLKNLKSMYEKSIKECTQNQIKEKIKIKKILKETKNLEHEYHVVKNSSHDDENILESINEALTSIYYIKHTIADYKSKLLNIEKYVSRNKKDFESKENILKKYLKTDDYINEKILINPLDFIFVEGDLDVGVIINIFV
jgi:hypothetical protein